MSVKVSVFACLSACVFFSVSSLKVSVNGKQQGNKESTSATAAAVVFQLMRQWTTTTADVLK